MSTIRPFRTEDTPALAEICLITADNGADATGLLPDDALWADIFLLPYLRFAPDLAFVLEVDGEAAGYVIGVTDTTAYETWFRDHWWPGRGWSPAPTGTHERHDGLLGLASRIGQDQTGGEKTSAEQTDHEPRAVDLAAFPAHLHIDLHPRAQGKGGGRALIEAFTAALRARSVQGVHLTASADNRGALAFYPRVGFSEIARDVGSVTFGMTLTAGMPLTDHEA